MGKGLLNLLRNKIVPMKSPLENSFSDGNQICESPKKHINEQFLSNKNPSLFLLLWYQIEYFIGITVAWLSDILIINYWTITCFQYQKLRGHNSQDLIWILIKFYYSRGFLNIIYLMAITGQHIKTVSLLSGHLFLYVKFFLHFSFGPREKEIDKRKIM